MNEKKEGMRKIKRKEKNENIARNMKNECEGKNEIIMTE